MVQDITGRVHYLQPAISAHVMFQSEVPGDVLCFRPLTLPAGAFSTNSQLLQSSSHQMRGDWARRLRPCVQTCQRSQEGCSSSSMS